tara:strand:+ start:1953 stop:2294 length:342 start_codon:yes stop_codon:yes gene_type:complete
MINKQNTNFLLLSNKIIDLIFSSLLGPWKIRSLGLLSLLFGYYLGSNLTVYYFEKTDNRILIVIIMMLIIETLVRLRGRFGIIGKAKLILLILDNLRIGCVYSIVLEAFKLGS